MEAGHSTQLLVPGYTGLPLSSGRRLRGGFRVERLGMETDYPGHQLGLSKKRAGWLVEWLRDKTTRGRVSAKEFSLGLGRLGFAAIALDWEPPLPRPATCLVVCSPNQDWQANSSHDVKGPVPLAGRKARGWR